MPTDRLVSTNTDTLYMCNSSFDLCIDAVISLSMVVVVGLKFMT